jgi:hypothetical protein
MATEKPTNPEGKVKEWEAGFRGFQRSIPVKKDFEGGAKEVEEFINKKPAGLPFLGQGHTGQAQARAKQKTREANVEKVRQELMSHRPLGKSRYTEISMGNSHSMIDSMMEKALPKKAGKPKKRTNKDREDERKAALAKLERMTGAMKACKGCKGSRLSPDPAVKAQPIKKDFEHMTAEHAKLDAASPSSKPQHVMETAHKLGWETPAMGQTGEEKKHAMATASPGVASSKQPGSSPSPFHESKPPMPLGVDKESPIKVKQAKPMAAVAGGKPVAGPSHGEGDVMTSVPKTFKSLTKSAILDLMMAKAHSDEQSPGNPSNENGPVRDTPHGGKGQAQTSVSEDGEDQFAGNPSNIQGSVSGTAHSGKGPAQTSVSGTPHGGSGPDRTSVAANAEDQFAGNPSQMSKAATSRAIPRMPRAMAASMDIWRSAMTQMNKHFTHHGAGPLFPETAESIDDESQKRATRDPEVFKSCEACGRTFRITKSMDEPCPSCSGNSKSCMAKSRGGYLISSFIKD